MNTLTQIHMQDLKRLQLLRYMDDDFMTVCLADNFEGIELILRILLKRKNIKIQSIRTQDTLKNLWGRSAVLDIHAIDDKNQEFDVEIQRSDNGAGAKRARHNSSLLDAHILKPGDSTENIPDSYVIFITEHDIMDAKQPIYPVERYITIGERNVLFGDGSHILYVNGEYRGSDEIGKLMHDFSCTNPDDMYYEPLAQKARYYKKNEKGVKAMSKILEDMRNQAALDSAKATAERMIKKGKLSLEEIADYIPVLTLEELKQLEAEIMQFS